MSGKGRTIHRRSMQVGLAPKLSHSERQIKKASQDLPYLEKLANRARLQDNLNSKVKELNAEKNRKIATNTRRSQSD
jgi:hypothetical protein